MTLGVPVLPLRSSKGKPTIVLIIVALLMALVSIGKLGSVIIKSSCMSGVVSARAAPGVDNLPVENEKPNALGDSRSYSDILVLVPCVA